MAKGKLPWLVVDHENDAKKSEEEDTEEMGPDIYALVVPGEETPSQALISVVVHSIAVFDEVIVSFKYTGIVAILLRSDENLLHLLDFLSRLGAEFIDVLLHVLSGICERFFGRLCPFLVSHSHTCA